jgi:ubiquitin thioesterase protein OTUB1
MDEIAPPSDSRPMVGEIEKPEVLLSEYQDASSPGFVPGIKYLSQKYSFMRRIRGDGNCFYRGFLFAYLEGLLKDHAKSEGANPIEATEAERRRITDIVTRSKEVLVNIGYSEMAIESFHDALVDLLENIFSYTSDSLLSLFQEDGQSDYYTWFMRLLTAGKMRIEEERFSPFIADPLFTDMESFCRREVEPMGKECEQIQIIALAEYLGVTIRIEYLDGRYVLFYSMYHISHLLMTHDIYLPVLDFHFFYPESLTKRAVLTI